MFGFVAWHLILVARHLDVKRCHVTTTSLEGELARRVILRGWFT